MYNLIPTKAERLLFIRLAPQAFADGGTVEDGGGGTGGAQSATEPDPGAMGAGTDEGGETAAVGTDAAGDAATSSDKDDEAEPPDYDKEFEEFLKRPEMKSRMNQRTQNAVRSRFKSADSELKAARELASLIAERYDVDANDPDAVKAALEADERYWTERAEEAGMDVETYRELSRLRREAKAREADEKAAQETRRVAELRVQAAALAKKYPGFDLDTELQNPKFRQMLDFGVDPESAYKNVHLDEILGATARHADKQAEMRVAEQVRANRARPSESGTGGTPVPDRSTVDFKNMSDDEWAKVREKRKRGEKISFV